MKKKAATWSMRSVISDCETSSLQQTAISSRYKECLYTFQHNDVMSGKINTFITPEMEVSKMDIYSDKNLVVSQDNTLERYVSTFVYKGSIHSQFAYADLSMEQKKQNHTFVHVEAIASKHTIAAGSTSIIYINVKPGRLKDFIPDWEQYADKLYEKNNPEKFFVSPALQIQQNSRLQQILLAFNGNTFGGVTRSLYAEAKAMELLALQLDELLQSTQKSPSQIFEISKIDHEKLVALYEYVTTNYLQPLSLSSLAKQFTLNEFKLKKGFKQLYNQSAFNYIHTLRMEHAQELLRTKDRTVNEVADLVGYSSIHNFSNAFYKMYNYRPSVIKQSGVSVKI